MKVYAYFLMSVACSTAAHFLRRHLPLIWGMLGPLPPTPASSFASLSAKVAPAPAPTLPTMTSFSSLFPPGSHHLDLSHCPYLTHNHCLSQPLTLLTECAPSSQAGVQHHAHSSSSAWRAPQTQAVLHLSCSLPRAQELKSSLHLRASRALRRGWSPR